MILSLALFRSIWGAEPKDDWPSLNRQPPSSTKSFVVGALDGFQPLKKAPCMLTRGTFGGGATERPILKGSDRVDTTPSRRRPREPANARLTAETKPFRGRKTSLPAYIALMRSTTAASAQMKPVAPIALHGSPCRAVEAMSRRRHHGSRTFRGATQSSAGDHRKRRCTADADTSRTEAPQRTSQSRVPISTLIGRFSSM